MFCFILFGGLKPLRVVLLTLPRDIRALYCLKYVEWKLGYLNRNGYLIIDLFHEVVKRHPNKLALVYEKEEYTFDQLDRFSNQIANLFASHGYVEGDRVSLFMESRPAYVGIWLGLAKLGIPTVFINFNLRNEALMNCINSANGRAIIYGAELSEAMNEIWPTLNTKMNDGERMQFFCADFGSPSNVKFNLFADSVRQLDKNENVLVQLDQLLNGGSVSDALPPYAMHVITGNGHPNFTIRQPLFYIFTSGTTGLPKAAVVNNSRFFVLNTAVKMFFRIKPDDVIYNPLPLYHMAGGMLGIGQMLLGGCTVVIRKKFSASQFWNDCNYYNCTIAQYIGEICRYLLAQPSRPAERQHKVRLMFGNGLRSQLWAEFQQRFCLKQIGEFYGATEANTNVINSENKPCAVGFTTRLLPMMHPIALIKIDESTGEVVRNKDGFCIRCEVGEVGELVGLVKQSHPLLQFEGYANREDSKKKILHNVFKTGDNYFRSGDLLEMDDLGYFYFHDRLGDTFRWRGENVSTMEVEALIRLCLPSDQVNRAIVVYGVKVPSHEGRAGMLSIEDARSDLDLVRLAEQMTIHLPSYACPVFIRLSRKLEITGTFKLIKKTLMNDGFDPSSSEDDKFYYWDIQTKSYRPIDATNYENILNGTIRT